MRTKDGDRIRKYVRSLEISAERTVESVISITYYMRGAITYEECMRRTPGEREAMVKFIQKRLESQKGSMNPVY